MDKRRRSLAKSLTWRVIAFTITLLVAFAFTKDASASLALSVAIHVINIVGYYLHERAWERIKWGR